MELFFLEQDSLYKIFTTIQKLPDGKDVSIVIEHTHPFFENPWRAHQIKNIIEQKNLTASFVVHHIKQKVVYEQVGLPFVLQKEQRRKKLLRVSSLFFFNIKKFHRYIYQKKNYMFYLMLGLEVIVIGIFLYFLSLVVLPSVTITLSAQRDVNEVMYNIRYFDAEVGRWSIESDVFALPYFRHTVSLAEEALVSEADLTYYSEPARGTVRISNATDQILRLREETQLVTEEGLIFLLPRKIAIPAQQWGRPGSVTVEIEAHSVDVDNVLMGDRWNIPQGTPLQIRLLERSSDFYGNIDIEAVFDFQWWMVQESDGLREDDVQQLLQQLRDTLTGSTLIRRLQEGHDVQGTLLLPFEQAISWSWIRYEIDHSEGMIRARVWWDVSYAFVYQDDVLDVVEEYLRDRPSPVSNVLSINDASLSFFDVHKHIADVLIVPTQISVIQGYDFERDPHAILQRIPYDIVWKNAEDVREMLLLYDEIGDVDISLTPPWSQTLPTTISRIHLRFE